MRESPLNAPFHPVESTPAKLNRRQAAKLRTRQKVLEAARALFAERGYEPATIRDIARGAGMSTGAVFANFQDKAELFEAVLGEEMETAAETLRAAAQVEGPVQTRLVAALSAGYADTLERLPLVQAIVARSWFQPVPAEMRARAATKPLLMIIGEVLRDGVRAGELSDQADIRLLSEMVWDVYLSNYRKAAYDGWSVDTLSARLAEQLGVILGGARAA